ncbi:MAG: N-acetylornithine carbamoyltransferase [Candidatus Helarchaeales archaeon]
MPKDFITTQEWSSSELEEILTLALDMKKYRHASKHDDILKKKDLVLIFFNPSTRTRISFEVAMHELGGNTIYMPADKMWIGSQSESIKDTAKVISRYADAIAIRIFPNVTNWKLGASHSVIREFSKWSDVPVINLEDDKYHPCQALSDIMTIRELKGALKGRKLTLSWAYHPRPLPMSVPNSVLLNATRFGLDVTVVHPPEFELEDEIMKMARENARKNASRLEFTHSLKDGYSDADIVYVKSWGSLKYYGNPKEEKKVRQPYRNHWICNKDLMSLTKPDSMLMHCLPIRRNVVATDEVLDDPVHSKIYLQAENRLHLQKALLVHLLGKKNNENT